MEISATTTSTHSQATSSSGSIAATGTSNTVIVQSPSDEGIVLSSLSDIQQLHHQSSNVSLTSSHSKHLLHQHHALIQTPQSSTTLSASVRSSSIQQASSSSTSSPLLSPPGKTIGRNNNGTMVTTSTPSNEAELQLYRVLQRASLLAYYDTLLEMGGDDVQQLCDAGEDEFLEIMALVGMATKPLHVRRFQKALAEWVNNPSSFQIPLSSADSSRVDFSPEPVTQSRSPFSTMSTYSPSSITGNPNFSAIGSISSNMGHSTMATTSTPSSSIPLTPTLTDDQVIRLTAEAEIVAREYQQRNRGREYPQSSKKRSTKDVDIIIKMSESDPRRMIGIRKYSAIYGRFDCKRRPEKPLTLHEVCVNEAAAQMCKFIPELLNRRVELFPLAREVVKKAGFGHSAGIARIAMGQQMMTPRSSTDDGGNQAKRMRTPSETTTVDYNKDLSSSAEEMRHNLIAIYQKLGKSFDVGEIAARLTSTRYSRSDYDDGDSRFSFSSSSSPQLQSSNGCDIEIEEECKMTLTDLTKSTDDEMAASTTSEHATNNGNGTLGVHVLSASGNNIIAVANPALALSPTLVEPLNIKRENLTADD